ncbi:gamma-glutamylaminecyclotransferase C isoform X2 [Parasteatoda tepidariorum]|uniref:gamma-glutamylaminecyclotransferase C isoform X2 n=1 Tax=Parasteatoda tepidariorum TaxID=114398 RepID=UPI0039BCB93E
MRFLNCLSLLCAKTLSYSVRVQCMYLHNTMLKHSINSLNLLKLQHLCREHYGRIHFSIGLCAKSFRETENEYAHEVLQTIPAYAKSTVKQPVAFGVSDYSEGNKELSEFAKNAENCLVFVYGTLKVDEPNYDQMIDPSLGRATYVSKGRTLQKWPLVIASRFNIPFLLYREGVGKNIVGEIFLVDQKMLSHMDAFECHPTYYTRIEVEVEVLEKENDSKFNLPTIVKPWVYFLMRFRPDLLTLNYLEDYHSRGSHGLEYISSEDTTDPEDIYK